MILFSIFEFFALSSTLAMNCLGIAIERGSLPSCSITEAKNINEKRVLDTKNSTIGNKIILSVMIEKLDFL
jgi:hypothetical protein